jgi:hypothetical protein
MFIETTNIYEEGVYSMIDRILRTDLEDVKRGYSYDNEKGVYRCLLCGKEFESGEVFQVDGRFYDAARRAGIHVEKEHKGMLEALTSYDKKYTGITEKQKELLFMLAEGLSDNEIARKTGAAPATIRHQRFVIREKAKQAKLFLAIYEVVEGSSAFRKSREPDDEFANIHHGARMVDERYFITAEEEEKITASVFESLNPLKLKAFPPKEKKIVILRKIAGQFARGRKYSEKEVNTIIGEIFEDFATIRRYLIEYGFMNRTTDCREYWINE